MSKVQIFDKAMCCSTGVCGPQVDPVLPKFAADLEWLQAQGHDVQRFNLAQQPEKFAGNATVQKLLADEGVECLPLVLVNDRVVSRREYPSRQNLALWTGATLESRTSPTPTADSGCCGGNSNCC